MMGLSMQLSVAYDFLAQRATARTCRVMELFGVDELAARQVVAEALELPIGAGDVVYFTGPSGSGKSSLLRECVRALERENVIWMDRLELPEQSLVDALPLGFEESLELLWACGLGEARLLLRTPAELSDGQRHRFRLALGLAQFIDAETPRRGDAASPGPGDPRVAVSGRLRVPRWLAADEFTATLDRTLAKVLAFNARRLADRTGTGFLLAGCHEDIVEDLAPDLLVRCDLDGQAKTEPRLSTGENGVVRCLDLGSPLPQATGRRSLGRLAKRPSKGAATVGERRPRRNTTGSEPRVH